MVRKDIKTTQPRRDIKTALVSDSVSHGNQQNNQTDEPQTKNALKERLLDFLKQNKLKIIIAACALLIISGLIWFLIWYFNGGGNRQINGVPLKTFSNNDFSIQVPSDYTKEEKDLGTAGFQYSFNSRANSKNEISKVYVLVGPLTDTCKKECLSGLDKTYTDTVIKSSKQDGYNGMKNINYIKDDIAEMNARLVYYDSVDKNKVIEKYYMAMMTSDDHLYEIIITSNNSDPGLAVSANKVINSFSTK